MEQKKPMKIIASGDLESACKKITNKTGVYCSWSDYLQNGPSIIANQIKPFYQPNWEYVEFLVDNKKYASFSGPQGEQFSLNNLNDDKHFIRWEKAEGLSKSVANNNLSPCIIREKPSVSGFIGTSDPSSLEGSIADQVYYALFDNMPVISNLEIKDDILSFDIDYNAPDTISEEEKNNRLKMINDFDLRINNISIPSDHPVNASLYENWSAPKNIQISSKGLLTFDGLGPGAYDYEIIIKDLDSKNSFKLIIKTTEFDLRLLNSNWLKNIEISIRVSAPGKAASDFTKRIFNNIEIQTIFGRRLFYWNREVVIPQEIFFDCVFLCHGQQYNGFKLSNDHKLYYLQGDVPILVYALGQSWVKEEYREINIINSLNNKNSDMFIKWLIQNSLREVEKV